MGKLQLVRSKGCIGIVCFCPRVRWHSIQWFYAFSISSNSTNESSPQPTNATVNPFLEGGPRTPKRPMDLDGSQSENFIFGHIQHPQKRNRLSEPHVHNLSCLNSISTVQDEPGRPPPGYKCRRCESTKVSLCCVWNIFWIWFWPAAFHQRLSWTDKATRKLRL